MTSKKGNGNYNGKMQRLALVVVDGGVFGGFDGVGGRVDLLVIADVGVGADLLIFRWGEELLFE